MNAVEMKDSGVEWLGEIPAHWDVKRLKFLTCKSLMYGANEAADDDNPDNPRYIRITDIRDDGTLRDDTFRSLPYEIAAPYLLENGDILFARSGSVGRTFRYRDGWGQVCFAGYLIKFSTDMRIAVPKFVDYFTSSKPYWDWLNSISIQTTIQNVNAEKYANLALGIPPLAEQRAIAAYLDRETARIDALIAKAQQLNALLREKRVVLISQAVTKGLDPAAPLKASGVEWLGEIPAHWDVKRLKFLGESIIGLTYSPSDVTDESNGVLVLRASNIRDGKLAYENCVYVSAEIPSRLVTRKHDILICSRSGSRSLIGKNAKIIGDGVDVTFGAFMTVFRSRFHDYISYVFNSRLFEQQSGSFMTSTINQLTISILDNIQLPYPPLAEQRAIAAHLDRETAKIDALIAKDDQLIALLREKRTSLISAAVTGKIDLRNT